MIAPRFIVVGLDKIRNRFLVKAVVLNREIDVVAENNAQLLLMKIRARASGRPGPNVITGEYRESWRVTKQGSGSYMVFTDAPQAARLEKGFIGIDSLGRHYEQPPFPHVWPAADEVEGAFVRDMFVMVGRGI